MIIILPGRDLYVTICPYTEFSGFFAFVGLHNYNHTTDTNLHLAFSFNITL